MTAPRLRPGNAGRAFGALTLALALALSSACGACNPAPLAGPAPDPAAAADACANLARLGCPLGTDPECAARVRLAVGSEQRILPAQLACARTATSRAALAGCSPYFACGQ